MKIRNTEKTYLGCQGKGNINLPTNPGRQPLSSSLAATPAPGAVSRCSLGSFASSGVLPSLLPLHPFQASIVAEAYDFVPDWAEILYQQVILKGDFNYLEEFKQQRLLRPSVFEEISIK